MLFPISSSLRQAAITTTRASTRRTLLTYTNYKSTNTNTNTRSLTTTTKHLYPRKDSQDRESINTDSTEHSKSGTDSDVAQNEDAAFNPDKTSPESQAEAAGQGNKVNPLEVSGANEEVSEARPPQEGGAEKGAEKEQTSGRGSPKKGASVRD